MTALLRPPYVLGHNADNFGCGYHRILRPIEVLSRVGVMAGRTAIEIWPDELLKGLKPDVVVWQRQIEDLQMEAMKRYRDTLPDTYFVYEIDDAMSAVPEWSWHRPQVPADIDERIGRAVALCDVVSVSTAELKRHMARICAEGTEIRVVPNMISRDEIGGAVTLRMNAPSRKDPKRLRVGWGGGISHKGDLAILRPVMEHFGKRVLWVFQGMQPEALEGLDIEVEFHNGVQPREYLGQIAKLDFDLVLAPLEDNLFNRCKSNLRLLEAAVLGYPVIASPVQPYIENHPPVFAHAKSTQDWIDAIDEFLTLTPALRREAAADLGAWVSARYIMDDHGAKRVKAWLPKGTEPFEVKNVPTNPLSGVTVVTKSDNAAVRQIGTRSATFRGARSGSHHVLYLRQGIGLRPNAIERMCRYLADDIASVSILSNDGGFASFPRPTQFSPLSPQNGQAIDDIVSQIFAGPEHVVTLPFPNGPVVLLNRRAVEQVGFPDDLSDGNEEPSLIEWGMMATARGLRHIVVPECFATALHPQQMTEAEILVQRAQMRWPVQQMPDPDPLREVRRRLEITFHREHHRLPLQPQGAIAYAQWAALFDTVTERDRTRMRALAEQFPVKPVFAFAGGAVASAQAWPFADLDGSAEHDWIIYARPGAEVRDHAAWLFAREIAADQNVGLIYADHDIVDMQDGSPTRGQAVDHDLKPNFDRELLLARDYITQVFAVRASLLNKATLDMLDEAGVYEHVLHLLACGAVTAPRHVTRVLAHVPRRAPEDEVPVVARKTAAAARIAVSAGWAGQVEPHPRAPYYARISYAGLVDPATAPLVSIIIPTKDRVEMLSPCVNTVLAQTTYPNFEVLIIDNGSKNPEHAKYLASVRDNSKVRIYAWIHKYNWSSLNNFAAGHAKGEYLCFLNDDTRVLTPDWLTEMVGAAMRPDAGAVGARLLYPNGTLQHCGVFVSEGLTGHHHKGLSEHSTGYQGLAVLAHEATAVTGACLVVSRAKYDEVGGLDEDLAHNFNDVAFGLAMRSKGYRNVVAAEAQLHHLEGVTRTPTMSPEGMANMEREGRILGEKWPVRDAYWNPQFAVIHHNGGSMVTGHNLDLLAWPGPEWPWREFDWHRERVLLIGDYDGTLAYAEHAAGNAVYVAAVNGHQIRIGTPPMENVPGWDVRADPSQAQQMLDAELGIERIVVRSFVGSPLELLTFLPRLRIPITFKPVTGEAVCPRLNFATPDGQSCGRGWSMAPQMSRDPKCRACVAEHGSFFGFVSMAGYWAAWTEFLSAATLDLSGLPEEALEAFEHHWLDTPEPAAA